MLPVFLQLDDSLKGTLGNLARIAVQIPATFLGNPGLNEDAAAVFRIAREFQLRASGDESRAVSMEDLLKAIRFAAFVLSSGCEFQGELKHWIATLAMQAQSQDPNFESLMKSYGVDRRLETSTRPQTSKAVSVQNINRVSEMHVRRTENGPEISTRVTESIWTARRK